MSERAMKVHPTSREANAEVQRFEELVPPEVRKSWDLVREKTSSAMSSAAQYARKNPRTTMLVGTAVGAAVGTMLFMKWRRSRRA